MNLFIEQQVSKAKAKFYHEYHRNRILTTPDLLWRSNRYKKPKLINFDLVQNHGDYDQVWVLPIFLQPGKIDYFIRSEEQLHHEVFYERHIIEVREEHVPFCKSLFILINFFLIVAKTLRTNQTTVEFVKAASVFRDWHEETPAQTAIASKHDFSLWKLSKIVLDESE